MMQLMQPQPSQSQPPLSQAPLSQSQPAPSSQPQDGKDKDKDDGDGELTDLFAARREEETARRDRSLAEFLVMLDGYKPLVSWYEEGDCMVLRGRSRKVTDSRFRKR